MMAMLLLGCVLAQDAAEEPTPEEDAVEQERAPELESPSERFSRRERAVAAAPAPLETTASPRAEATLWTTTAALALALGPAVLGVAASGVVYLSGATLAVAWATLSGSMTPWTVGTSLATGAVLPALLVPVVGLAVLAVIPFVTVCTVVWAAHNAGWRLPVVTTVLAIFGPPAVLGGLGLVLGAALWVASGFALLMMATAPQSAQEGQASGRPVLGGGLFYYFIFLGTVTLALAAPAAGALLGQLLGVGALTAVSYWMGGPIQHWTVGQLFYVGNGE